MGPTLGNTLGEPDTPCPLPLAICVRPQHLQPCNLIICWIFFNVKPTPFKISVD